MDRWHAARLAAGQARHRAAASIGDAPAPAIVARLLADSGYDVARYPSAHALLGGAWAALFPDAEIAACDGSLSAERQAFALAHELGHLLLHEGRPTGEGAAHRCGLDEIEPPDGSYGSDGSLAIYNPRQEREREANAFALHLLAPRDLVWRLFVAERLGARGIARRLGISRALALQALAGLLEPLPVAATGGAGPLGLDSSQRRAAETTATRAVVEAGPGTGKTGTLVARVAHLIRERGTAPERLLVLTFSNRACEELRQRIGASLGAGADRVAVRTFHAFAHEILRRYAAAAGLAPDFRVLDRPAILALLQARLDDRAPADLLDAISLERPTAALVALAEAVGRLKEELFDAGSFAQLARSLIETGVPGAADPVGDVERLGRLSAFFAWYETVLGDAGALDFGALIARVVALFRNQPAIRDEVRRALPHALVDEYQDINDASAALLHALCTADGADATLWAVGDPRQSIYRWRGAAPESLRAGGALGAAPAAFALAVNYRSVAPIVRLVGGVAAMMDGEGAPPALERWLSVRAGADRIGSPAAIAVATAPDGAAELAGLAECVAASVDQGRPYGDHAVLCATHAQGDEIAGALRRRGLPVCRSGEPADDPQVRRALAMLSLASGQAAALLAFSGHTLVGAGEGMPAPLLSGDGAVAMLDAAHRRGAGILQALLSPPPDLAPGDRLAARVLARAARALPAARRSEVPGSHWGSLARYLFDAPYAAARPVLARAGDQAIGHPPLAALLAFARRYDATPVPYRAATLPQHAQLSLEAGEGLGGGVGTDLTADGVRVLTVHASKGLEFPVVFVPNLARGRFPARGRGRLLPPGILPIDEARARAKDDDCLFFVAISRARDRLVLSRAERYAGRAAAPSAQLELASPTFAVDPPQQLRWTGQGREDRAVAEQEDRGAAETVAVEARALETYLECPRRFAFAETFGPVLPSVESGYPHFHQAIRSALADLQRTAAGAEPGPDGSFEGGRAGQISAREAEALLERAWCAPHPDHPLEAAYRERARRMIARAAETSAGSAPVAHDVEYTVRRPAGTIRVRVDRVEEPEGGEPAAVRFRTGRPSDDHRRDYRTALYGAALAARHGGGQVRQRYLLTGETEGRQARASTLEARLRECDAALEGIAGRRFPPRPGDRCHSCPFWLACPARGKGRDQGGS